MEGNTICIPISTVSIQYSSAPAEDSQSSYTPGLPSFIPTILDSHETKDTQFTCIGQENETHQLELFVVQTQNGFVSNEEMSENM